MALRLRYAEGVGFAPRRGAAGLVLGPFGAASAPAAPLALDQLLASLPAPSAAAERLRDASPGAHEALEALADLGAIEEVAVDDEGRVRCTLGGRPARMAAAASTDARAAGPRRLAPDCFARPSGAALRLATPRHAGTAELSPADLAAALAGPPWSEPVHRDVAALLGAGGFLAPAQDRSPEAPDWPFHDALLHAAASLGRTGGQGYGRPAAPRPRRLAPVAPFRGSIEPLPPPRPARDPGLFATLAERRSRRAFSVEPLDLETLSTLLARALGRRAGDGPPRFPYPSGGALDEMTAILSLRRVGAPPELAVYDAAAHALRRPPDAGGVGAAAALAMLSAPVCEPTRRERLTAPPAERAATADHEPFAALPDSDGAGPAPAVAIVLAADYGRVDQAYDAIAYATILRGVGAIYQTVALVAEALGLACCPVGGGWGALETGPLRECLGGRAIVGGLVLGRRAEGPA